MTKLEEVARALAKENGDDFDAIPRDKAHWVEMGQGRGVNELRQHDYLGMARAAIEAMRAPTPEMVAAGEGFNFADVTWEVMIDEALRTNEETGK